MRRRTMLGWAVAMVGWATAGAFGQDAGAADGADPRASFASRLSASAQVGALWIEDRAVGFSLEFSDGPRYEGRAGTAPLVGFVLGFDVFPALTIEADYARAWSSLGMDASIGGTPLPDPVLEKGMIVVDMYGLRGRFSYPSGHPLRASVLLGRGTINVDLDTATLGDPIGRIFGPSGSTAREPMWEVGAGLAWAPGSHWGLRLDLVDHIQRCSGETHSEINICGRDGSIDSLHHVALTGAVALAF